MSAANVWLTSMTTTATTSTISTESAATTAAAVARHLRKLGVDDLLGFLKDRDEITRLFRICSFVSVRRASHEEQKGEGLLSVVNSVMAVP